MVILVAVASAATVGMSMVVAATVVVSMVMTLVVSMVMTLVVSMVAASAVSMVASAATMGPERRRPFGAWVAE